MEENKKDFLIMKSGWNEALRNVLDVINKKYDVYKNIDSLKMDIEKLLNVLGNYDKNNFPCEILKYYENKEYGIVILNGVDFIEGYMLNLEDKTYEEIDKVKCLYDINNFQANSKKGYKTEEEARLELNRILEKFKSGKNEI